MSQRPFTNQDVVDDIYVESTDELFDLISPTKSGSLLGSYIFRGEHNHTFKLIPKALRPEYERTFSSYSGIYNMNAPGQIDSQDLQIESEWHILKNFYQESDNRGLTLPFVSHLRKPSESDPFYSVRSTKWLPEIIYDLAALAQHYGVPTRLIDWTKNPYTALFFACEGQVRNYIPNSYMVLWAFCKLLFDFSYKSQQLIPIKVIIPPYSKNPNLLAQEGLLMFWEETKDGKATSLGVNRDSIDNRLLNYLNDDKNIDRSFDTRTTLFKRILIPSHLCNQIMNCLFKLNHSASKLFPGYHGVHLTLEIRALIDKNASEHGLLP